MSDIEHQVAQVDAALQFLPILRYKTPITGAFSGMS
jgi:hypothetical protein